MFKGLRFLSFILAFALVLSGCKFQDKEVYLSTGNGFANAFTLGTLKCSKKEAVFYVASIREHFKSLGGAELHLDEDDIMDNRLINGALSLASRVYLLNIYAADKAISLTKEEEGVVSSLAESYYKSLSSEDKSFLELGSADIRDIGLRYALALKAYDILMDGVDGEISDDEARVMEGYVIRMQDREKLSELEERIRRGSDFATLTQVYSLDSKRIVSFGREVYPPQVDEVAFSLEVGEVSGRIQCGEDYYFVQCKKKYDEVKSEENKIRIVERRKKALLSRVLKEQGESIYSELNKEFFGSLDLNSMSLSPERTFFSVLEERLNF